MPPPQVMTSTGLISAPLAEVVRYDAFWSRRVSHNPQTDRFSAPYPDMSIEGKSPFKAKKVEPKLPKIESEAELLADAKKKREKRIKREAEEATKDKKHIRYNFGGRILVDNGNLSLEDVYDFFHGSDKHAEDSTSLIIGPNGVKEARSDDDAEVTSKIKINQIDPDDGVDDKDMRPGVQSEGQSLGLQSRQSDAKVSVTFCETKNVDTNPDKDPRSSVNFLRLRTLRDAEEGASARLSMRASGTYCTNKGARDRETAKHRNSTSSASHGYLNLKRNEEYYRLSQEFGGQKRNSSLRPRESILRKDSKLSNTPKMSPRPSVAFRQSNQPPSASGSAFLGTGIFEGMRRSHNFQEGRPLSTGGKVSINPAIEHDGHTMEFEHVRITRIKVDEKEEGKTFRLSFAPNPERQEDQNLNYTTEHVRFVPDDYKEERTPSFEELRRSKILPEERKEGTAFRRTYRIYHGTDGGVYGLNTNFPLSCGRQDLKKFRMTSKSNPEDEITLLAHGDGIVFGYYKDDSNAPSRSCLRNRDAFQLIYNTSDAVVGFKTNQFKEDHSADFERMRQEMIIQGEKEEGMAIRAYWQMARNEEVNFEEDVPLKHFQDHHDATERKEGRQLPIIGDGPSRGTRRSSTRSKRSNKRSY